MYHFVESGSERGGLREIVVEHWLAVYGAPLPSAPKAEQLGKWKRSERDRDFGRQGEQFIEEAYWYPARTCLSHLRLYGT